MKAKEFNDRYWASTQDKPFKDEFGKIIVKELFERFSVVSKVEYTEGKNLVDVWVTDDKGRRVAIELKVRSKYSTDNYKKEGTHLVNSDKLERYKKLIYDKKADMIVLVSVWYDGEIWISNMLDVPEYKKRYQNMTTNVSGATNGIKILKETAEWKPNLVYHYSVDVEDGVFMPVIYK